VTGDTVELNTQGKMVERIGYLELDNVEIYNCSQIDTFKAALRFENSNKGYSSVRNSAIHNGYGFGVQVKNS
jgi:hypothetical protein